MRNNMRKTYVLVAGAWLCGWCWHAVQEKLELMGHKVIAVDLPGHGDNKLSLSEQNMESYAKYVAEIIASEEQPVILVGHSMSGAIACQAAEYQPEKIKKLVVLCGFILNNGESINGLQDGIKPTDWTKIADSGMGVLSSDRKVTYLHADLVRNRIGDLPDDEIELLLAHLGGEAIAAQWQVITTGKNFASVPKIYIKTIHDLMLPLPLQEQMSQRGVDKTYSIDSGHFPFLSAPQELTDILLDID